MIRQHLGWMLLAVVVVATPALAQDEDDDDLLILDEEEEEPLVVDSLQIYRAFKEELKGMAIEEELDAWWRYLAKYPDTAYRKEIERRIDELEGAMLDEAEAEAPDYVDVTDTARGAKYDELPFVEPFGFLTNNTRKKVHLGMSYGYKSTFNYALGVEYAIKRNFSVFGLADHFGQGIGFNIHAGVKYAAIKDTRTGGLLTFGLGIKGGSVNGPYFGMDPFIGVGVCPRDKPVTLQFQAGMDMRFTPWSWDAHLGLNLGLRPSEKVTIFLETTGHNKIRKMTSYEAIIGETCGDDSNDDVDCVTEYFGFYEAAAGIKLFPRENIEITLALRAPYFYRHWQHYHPIGGGGSVMIYF